MHMRIVGQSTLKNRCVNVPTWCAPVLAALFMDELQSWIALLATFSRKDKHEQSRIGAEVYEGDITQ